eukprot:901345-Alexandrium_andersonii.AAC.1
MVSTAAERSAGVVSDVASLGACPAVDTVPVQFHGIAWERFPYASISPSPSPCVSRWRRRSGGAEEPE